jgi:hypothetical protein
VRSVKLTACLSGFFMLSTGGILLACLLLVSGQRGRSSTHSGEPSSGSWGAGGCTSPKRYLHLRQHCETQLIV